MTRNVVNLRGAAVCVAASGRHSAQQQGADEIAGLIEAPDMLPRSRSVHGARVHFMTPADGDTVSSPICIHSGHESMSVTKPGDNYPNSGRHQILIDGNLPGLGKRVPASENYVQLGDGPISAESTPEPGQHTRRIMLGDHGHIPHDPPLLCYPSG